MGDNSIKRVCFKNLNIVFLPMVHRYKMCSDILKVTSGGKAEIENVKNDKSSILTPPTDATLKMSLHFLHL